MKTMKKLLAIVLSLLMVMSMAVTVAADDEYTITIKNTEGSNVSINGKTFNAYKIFDASVSEDGNNVSYTIAANSAWKTVVDAYIAAEKAKEGNDGKCWLELVENPANANEYLVKSSEGADEENARDFADYLVRNVAGKTADGTATGTTDETATITLDKAGYYLVTGEGTAEKDQTVVAAAALYTTMPNAEIDLKAEAPTITKKIVEGEDLVDANTAKVGDTVNYKITSKVPDMTGYKNYAFIVTDTLSKGLTFNDDVKVTIGGTEKTKGTDYTVTSAVAADGSGATVITIVFKNFIANTKDDAIVIEYSANVNADAVIGADGNPNEVKLTYSNNPNEDGEGNWEDDKPNTPTGETPKDIVKTYLTGIQITKKDGTTKAVLEGATFKISGNGIEKIIRKGEKFVEADDGEYYKLKDGSYTKDAPTDDTTDLYESTTTKYTRTIVDEVDSKAVVVDLEVTSGADGLVTFEGLNEGTYTITEITAPDGYNLLDKAIELTIESDINKDTVVAADGSTKATWTVKDVKGATGVEANADGIITFDVENNKGQKLPETGGIGTTIFYVVGGAMMFIAVVLLVTKKKMSDKK